MKVITTQNVYTREVMDLCESHFDAHANGDAQVQHGLHGGECDACLRSNARHMTYDGEGSEQGMYTLAEARAKWNTVEFDSETNTISVDDSKSDPRNVCERLSAYNDGTGDLGVIVKQALADDPNATDADIIAIIEEARADAKMERERT